MSYPSCMQCKYCKDYKLHDGYNLSYCSIENGYVVDNEKVKCDDFKKGIK